MPRPKTREWNRYYQTARYKSELIGVEGDQGRLYQIFLNLLLNAAHALKASPVPRPAIQIVSTRDVGRSGQRLVRSV